jgi:hypothetical protein
VVTAIAVPGTEPSYKALQQFAYFQECLLGKAESKSLVDAYCTLLLPPISARTDPSPGSW